MPTPSRTPSDKRPSMGNYVTPERLDAVIATLRADIYRAMMMQTAVTVGLLGVILAAPRWLG